MEQLNKKIVLFIAALALVVLLLGLYVLLRNRATPPPVAAPPVERPLTEEDKMNILRQLSTRTASAAERKNILRMLMQ